MVGNVYLGKVQNVLPSMEAAFVDIGRGRNAVLYAGEVNWDATGLEGKARSIEQALKSGESVLVQVTKDPVGHKGAAPPLRAPGSPATSRSPVDTWSTCRTATPLASRASSPMWSVAGCATSSRT